ncbi:hypothetical protein DFH11DRAFT_1882516 [Phellopilus nigrolimitatus]|nr:hypothetical protein DFH11DRAFT_1882516 [Phellopilus nigrolimitatus]
MSSPRTQPFVTRQGNQEAEVCHSDFDGRRGAREREVVRMWTRREELRLPHTGTHVLHWRPEAAMATFACKNDVLMLYLYFMKNRYDVHTLRDAWFKPFPPPFLLPHHHTLMSSLSSPLPLPEPRPRRSHRRPRPSSPLPPSSSPRPSDVLAVTLSRFRRHAPLSQPTLVHADHTPSTGKKKENLA